MVVGLHVVEINFTFRGLWLFFFFAFGPGPIKLSFQRKDDRKVIALTKRLWYHHLLKHGLSGIFLPRLLQVPFSFCRPEIPVQYCLLCNQFLPCDKPIAIDHFKYQVSTNLPRHSCLKATDPYHTTLRIDQTLDSMRERESCVRLLTP